MKVIEQKYNNLNRRYYHGFRPDNPQLKSCSKYEFYITNNFLYAASYAGKKGYVEEYRLSKEINILNLNCQSDYEKLKNKGIDVNNLLGRDWFSYFRGDFEERNKVLKIIKDLGYDGYFNYEIDDELVMHSIAANQEISTINKRAPSIGIFNRNVLNKVDTYKDLTFNLEIKKYADIELDYIEYKLLDLYLNNKYNKSNLEILLDEIRSEVFNYDFMQLYNLFFKFDPKNYLEDYDELNKKFGKIKLIEDKKRFYYERPMIGGIWE